MRGGVLFSGGKDSTFALHQASKHHEIACLISLISNNPESYMFHTPNIQLTQIQAQTMGLPLIQKQTKGLKENELKDLKQALNLAKKKFRIEGIITGTIRSIYQTTRIQKICKQLDLWCFNPLWLKNPVELLNQLVENDFKVVISGVFAYPLDESLLGNLIDYETIDRLRKLSEKHKLDSAGEGGEMETTVLDAPLFQKKIEILEHSILYKNNHGIFKIEKTRLTTK